eukprot:759935-Hanusia_phi.AAC.4
MVDLDDLWQDTRGTLAPILPRRPYPVRMRGRLLIHAADKPQVYKVPQTIRSSSGRDSKSTGSSRSSGLS